MEHVRRPVDNAGKRSAATQAVNRTKLFGEARDHAVRRVACRHECLKRASEVGEHRGNLGPSRDPQPSRCIAKCPGLVPIAADERGVRGVGDTQQASEEILDPTLVMMRADGERHEAVARLAAHGCDVAEVAGQGSGADALCGHVGGEVDAFCERVRLEQQIFVGARAEDGAIVTDAGCHAGACFYRSSNTGDEAEFAEGGKVVRDIGGAPEALGSDFEVVDEPGRAEFGCGHHHQRLARGAFLAVAGSERSVSHAAPYSAFAAQQSKIACFQGAEIRSPGYTFWSGAAQLAR